MGTPHTLVHRIQDWAERTPDVVALRDLAADGSWSEVSWAGYWTAVRECAKGLIALGHTPGDTVALVGENRPEWVIAQLGAMAAQGVPALIYVTNTAEQTAYIVGHSQARFAVCDRAEQLDKYLEGQSAGTTKVEHFVTMDDLGERDTGAAQLHSLDALRALGREQRGDELDRRLAATGADDLAMLIYTSGTTGLPKGAEYTHRGICVVADGILERLPVLHEVYRYVSYLPLCHAAEQMCTNFGAITAGGTVSFCADLKRIKDYLTAVRPTCFLGVPRVWEKFEAALRAKLSEATGLKARLAAWAMRTELACHRKAMAQHRPYNPLRRRIANKLVLSKIRTALGLDQLRFACTGAAPISVATLDFFSSLGIVVHEGFGMTETSGLATLPEFGYPVVGTVGFALPGVEIKIAEDGEILLKGANMVRGYHRLPEKTRELYNADGWLLTGDLGSLDADGNLRITGRKKDLLITAGGKNVAPAELEAYLKSIPGIGQAVVVGDRQPYLCALLVLDAEGLPELAEKLGIPATSLEEVATHPELKPYLDMQVEQACNQQVARYQTIKKFVVLPTEFSVDSGELTPTMKLKRNVINDRYRDRIDAFYA